MSLAALSYPSPTPQGMEEFFFANYQHHLALIGALKQTKGVVMELFQIYPVVPAADMTTFGRQHQRQHDIMNNILGIPSVDLSSLDLKDKKNLDSWMYQHLVQHRVAGELCGLPI